MKNSIILPEEHNSRGPSVKAFIKEYEHNYTIILRQ